MKIISRPDIFAVGFKYDPAKIKLMHQLGMKWDKRNRLWYREDPSKLFFQNFVTLFPDQQQHAPEWFKPDYNKWVPSGYLMEHQLKAAKKAVQINRYGFFHGIGCHPAGTKILMSDGHIKNVEDIKIGDHVIGPDGIRKKVLKLYSGEENLYKVIPIKGEPFGVNESHILALREYKNLWKRHDYKFRNIIVRDVLKFKKWQLRNKFKLYRSEAINFYRNKLRLEIDPYFLGILLGDGSLRNANPNITTADKEIVKEIYLQAKKWSLYIRKELQPGNKSSVYHFRANKQRADYSKYKISQLNIELENLGLMDKKSGNKFIPFKYKTSTQKNRLEILAGLIDTDGCLVPPSGYEFVSKSKQLADDVIFIVRSLGLAAYKSIKIVNEISYYRVSISGDVDKIPCRIPRKKAPARKQKKNPLIVGFKIKPNGFGEYYGFEIGGDHLYLLGDFTVTHNTGKTVLGIELIKQKQVKTLVVCPLSIIRRAWLDDIEKFAPELTRANLWELKQPKSVAGRSRFITKLANSQVCIINFESFKSLCPKLKEAGFQMLLIDESSVCKSGLTDITKQLIEFSGNMDFVYLFSGNPAPNNEIEYWGQTQIIDPLLFGASFYRFRQIWFMSLGYGGFKYELNPQLKDSFMEKLAGISEVVEREDVLDLPEPNYSIREVYLNKNELGAYNEMKRHLELEFQGIEVVAANSAVKQMKLREGTSGFYLRDDIVLKNGKAKKVSVPVHVGDTKLKELEVLLDEIGDHQVIIWNHFHYEGDQIIRMLEKRRLKSKKDYSFVRVDGTETNQDKKDQWIKEFMEGEHQYIIAHPKSIGHGHRLENAFNAIYFSISHSYEAYDQSLGRLQRKNQRNRCNFFFLIAVGTVDEIIMKCLKVKGDVKQAVFNYIKGRM